VTVRVVEGDGGDGDAEVSLFCGLIFHSTADAIAADSGYPGGGFATGPVAEGGIDGRNDFLVDDVAGDGDEDVVRYVLLGEVAHNHIAVYALDGLLRPGDSRRAVVGPEDGSRAAGRRAGPANRHHRQLFEDDLALLLHLAGVHERRRTSSKRTSRARSMWGRAALM